MNFKTLSLMAVSIIVLSGCSHSFSERKAPCPPSAYTGKNPCNPVPINVAFKDVDRKGLAS